MDATKIAEFLNQGIIDIAGVKLNVSHIAAVGVVLLLTSR